MALKQNIFAAFLDHVCQADTVFNLTILILVSISLTPGFIGVLKLICFTHKIEVLH